MGIDVTNSVAVQTLLQADGFPADLNLTSIVQAMDWALREIRTKAPLVSSGTFNTIDNQDTYDVFNYLNTNPAPHELVNSLGLRVLDLQWSPTPQYSVNPSQLIFYQGPGFGPYNGRGVFPFDQMLIRESDALIYEHGAASLREHYTIGGWRHTTTDVGVPIILDPTPTYVTQVYLAYISARPDAIYQTIFQTPYLTLIEARVCRIVSRLSRTTAGIKFALLEDSGKKADSWLKEADQLENRASQEISEILTGEIAAGTRS